MKTFLCLSHRTNNNKSEAYLEGMKTRYFQAQRFRALLSEAYLEGMKTS